jgi:predicted regulator of Ras-like GTPase activity (Roadblock/LC7/MglB family)
VSLEALLNELVSKVEGATGAIVLEADGEAVQWCDATDNERLRLRGAYVAVVLRSCVAAAARANLAGLSCLVVEYEGSSFVAQEIDRDCFVLLELGASANIGEAMFRLKRTIEELRCEIGS